MNEPFGAAAIYRHGRELPIAFGDFPLYVFELVHDLRYVRIGESVVLMPVWDVVAVLAVEPHESVEARPVEEEEIIWVMRFVEPVADLIVVIPPPRFQACAFGFKELPTAGGGELSVLDGPIEVDDMDVRVREQCPPRGEVEADDARAHERLDPDRPGSGWGAPRDPRDELRLDALCLDGRDVDLLGALHVFYTCGLSHGIVLSTELRPETFPRFR